MKTLGLLFIIVILIQYSLAQNITKVNRGIQGYQGMSYAAAIMQVNDTYNTPWKVTDCQQCFKARGRMCTYKDGSSMISITQSSISGHGICCDPDNLSPNCGLDSTQFRGFKDDQIICGPPSYKNQTQVEQLPALTGMDNFKFFSYCPKTMINHNKCGRPSNTTNIYANMTVQTLNTTQMRYNPSETERKFDYCYYQILSQENATESTSYANITDRKDGLRIHLKVTKAKNVTVHFYGGHDRENATTWVINPNNDSPKLKLEYSWKAEKGILIVATPDKGKETEFEFEYWIAPFEESFIVRVYDQNFRGVFGQQAQKVYIGGVVGIIVICIILCIVCTRCLFRNTKIQAYELNEQQSTTDIQATQFDNEGENLETVDGNDFKNPGLQYDQNGENLDKPRRKSKKHKRDRKNSESGIDEDDIEDTQKEKDKKKKKKKSKKHRRESNSAEEEEIN